ncbi:hypothetical protein O0I10_010032 [Lichtheimia ornata]|uniref:Uncharacterized protein n=1 Tax=Lichtheimia ornata TaxID=688661 RepID=A0AAD7XVI6_9FUNG|nr:uncharacterized protein O0I10_010032 [Lichtheimia ornata]KAJ8654336.1 hypothetical protein O0I10_010032 [Lichtheimia ornata]
MAFKILPFFIVLIALACVNHAAPLVRTSMNVNKRDFDLDDDCLGDVFDKRDEEEPADSPEDIRDDLMEKKR